MPTNVHVCRVEVLRQLQNFIRHHMMGDITNCRTAQQVCEWFEGSIIDRLRDNGRDPPQGPTLYTLR